MGQGSRVAATAIGGRAHPVEFDLAAQVTDAVVFDEKERRRVKTKNDVLTRLAMNVGPRAKARLVFKDGEAPVMMYVSLWESLTVREERERVREHDLARTVDERLRQRNRCESKAYQICYMRLVYMADEFRGAPDLLAPDTWSRSSSRICGMKEKIRAIPPRQVLRVPACR